MSLIFRVRIYSQYRKKPKAQAWYSIIPALAQEWAVTTETVRYSYDIDSGYGELLNIIGRIVGTDRGYLGNTGLDVYQFASGGNTLYNGSVTYSGSVTYNSVTVNDYIVEFGDEAAQFSDTSIAENKDLEDEYFRLLIRSKITKNNSDATIESILETFNFIMPNARPYHLIDNEDMSYHIEFYGSISEIDRWVLQSVDMLPKPQGVRFNGFLEIINFAEFGDESAEFGDESAEFLTFIGGK